MRPESDTELLRTQLEPKLISKVSTALGVSLGTNWRAVEGPYPNANSPSCIQFQVRTGTEWRTVHAISADGDIIWPGSATGNRNAPITTPNSATNPAHLSNNVKAAANVNIAGPWPTTQNFTVDHGGPLLFSWMITGSSAGVGAQTVTINIDGVTVNISAFTFYAAGARFPLVGYQTFNQGTYAAGTHSVQFVWSGASDANDRLMYSFLELPLA